MYKYLSSTLSSVWKDLYSFILYLFLCDLRSITKIPSNTVTLASLQSSCQNAGHSQHALPPLAGSHLLVLDCFFFLDNFWLFEHLPEAKLE